MSVNSELAALNSLGNMSLEGSIADRGVNTGVLSSGHGVSFDGSRWVCGHGGNATEARR